MKKAISIFIILSIIIGIAPVSAISNEKVEYTISSSYDFQSTSMGNSLMNDLAVGTENTMEISSTEDGVTTIVLPEASLEGKFYIFDEGAYAGKMLVGDFDSFANDIEVNTVRVDKDINPDRTTLIDTSKSGSIVLTIELTSNNEELKYQAELSENEYASLIMSAEQNKDSFMINNTEYDYRDWITELDLGPISATPVSMGFDMGESTPATRALTVSLQDLRDFIIAARASGTIGVDPTDYGISQSYLTDSGWDNQASTWTDNTQQHILKYTQGSDTPFYYTWISLVDITGHEESKMASLEINLSMGVMIEYAPGGYARIFMDDYGCKMDEIKIVVGNFKSGNKLGIIQKSTLDGQVNNNSGAQWTVLLGLVDSVWASIASTILDFCNFTLASPTSRFGGTETYGDTAEAQLQSVKTGFQIVVADRRDSTTEFLRGSGDDVILECVTDIYYTDWDFDFDYMVSV